MTTSILPTGDEVRILIVDDEPDVHAVTRMALRRMKFRGQSVELLSAASGREALETLRRTSSVALVLLDVVMESDTAGLDTCEKIRSELGNHLTRIVLRTGQPGVAPEREAIEKYDIDGYLPKAELTSTRLYAAARVALKSYWELVELERHRSCLAAIHECAVALQSYEPIETTLERILGAAVTVCPGSLAVMQLDTFEHDGSPVSYKLHRAPAGAAEVARTSADAARARVQLQVRELGLRAPQQLDDGFFVPINIAHEMGHGWIFVQAASIDVMAGHSLPLLAAHAANALYAAIAQHNASERGDDAFDEMVI